MAADLDLVVRPAHVDDLAVAVDATEIARAIDAPAAERDEPIRGLVRQVEVAQGDSRPTDADLADLPVRNRIPIGVQQDHGIRRQRPPDGDGPTGQQLAPGRGDRGFGGAVGVQHAAARLAPPLDQSGGTGLAADEQAPHPRQVVRNRGQQGRHAVQHRDPRLLEEVGEFGTQAPGVVRTDHQGRPGGQGRPDLLDREVERDGHALVDPVRGTDVVHRRHDGDEVADARLRDHHALGSSAGPGRVDDVALRLRCGTGEEVVVGAADCHRNPAARLAGDLRVGEVQGQDVAWQVLETGLQIRRRHQQVERRVLRDVGDPLGRRCRVDGHERRPRLGDAEQCDVGGARADQQDPDSRSGAEAELSQVVGEAVGPLVEFRVRQLLIAVSDRDRGRATVDAGLEEVVQALRYLSAGG